MSGMPSGWIDVSRRDRFPELMDDPRLEPDRHHVALAALRRINRLSSCERILWQALDELAGSLNRPLRVLDLATGGGDVVTGLAKRAQRGRRAIEFQACDISDRALKYASDHARRQGVEQLRFFQLNALQDPIPEGFDVTMCSLFLHHLSDSDAAKVLHRMAQAAGIAVLVNDLRRTHLGFLLAQAGCRLLTRSHVVHTDGPLSVRAAFTDREVSRLAESAGLRGARVRHFWPQRFLLQWVRP